MATGSVNYHSFKAHTGSIAKNELDNAFISEVAEVFATINQLITDDGGILATSALLKSEEDSFVKAVNDRRSFVVPPFILQPITWILGTLTKIFWKMN